MDHMTEVVVCVVAKFRVWVQAFILPFFPSGGAKEPVRDQSCRADQNRQREELQDCMFWPEGFQTHMSTLSRLMNSNSRDT